VRRGRSDDPGRIAPGAAARAHPSGPYRAGVVRAWVACSKP